MKDQSLFYQKGKKAVLLFHAFTSNPKDMLSLGRALEREGYTVYAPVFSGHGTTDPDDLFDYSVEDWVQDGKEALAFLREKGYEQVAALGLSLGGVVATDLLLNEEVLGGGTFASPVVSEYETSVARHFMVWYNNMKEKAGLDQDERERIEPEARQKVKAILKGVNRHVARMEEDYSGLKKKVFIAQGGKDNMINEQSGKKFKEKLTNAQVDFHYYEEGPHVLTTGKIGKELQQDVLAYLSSLEWSV